MWNILCNSVSSMAPVPTDQHPCDGSNFRPISVLNYPTFRELQPRKGLNNLHTSKHFRLKYNKQFRILHRICLACLQTLRYSYFRVKNLNLRRKLKASKPVGTVVQLVPLSGTGPREKNKNIATPSNLYKNLVTNFLSRHHGNS
jgi:hypothetical protein